MVSTVNSRGFLAGKPRADTISTMATQGRLHCTQRFGRRAGFRPQWPAYAAQFPPHRNTGFILYRKASINRNDAIGAPRIQVSTARGSVLHAIEARPQALTSSIHPKLGVRSKHQRLHRYALLRIFRPVLGIVRIYLNRLGVIRQTVRSSRSIC